jgi:hypothetical protein
MSVAADALEHGFRVTRKGSPKYTMGKKLPTEFDAMSVRSPGPKYSMGKESRAQPWSRQPVYRMREKLDMVIGGSVPSWQNSIPGPQYDIGFHHLPRQPVFTMGKKPNDLQRTQSAPDALPGADTMEKAFALKKSSPRWSIVSRREDDSSARAANRSPGPKYSEDVNVVKRRAPRHTIGPKLPLPGSKNTNPGPGAYADTLNSTHGAFGRSFSCSFGVGPRWEGKTYEMVSSGAMGRYNRPRV